jgi:hypothetical protein
MTYISIVLCYILHLDVRQLMALWMVHPLDHEARRKMDGLNNKNDSMIQV